MAVSNPTANYGWVLPVVGGSIGSWGGLLNVVIGEDGASGGVKGIDQVIADLQAEVDALETDVAALDTRVDAIEAAGAGAHYAQVTNGSDQSISQGSFQQVLWGTVSFDQGGLTGLNRLTIPAGGAGLYEVRAVLAVQSRAVSDDSFQWQVEIRKNGLEVVAAAFVPHLDDGFNADSGDVTLVASVLDVAADDDFFEVWVRCDEPGSSGAGAVRTGDGTYFEAVRLAPVS